MNLNLSVKGKYTALSLNKKWREDCILKSPKVKCFKMIFPLLDFANIKMLCTFLHTSQWGTNFFVFEITEHTLVWLNLCELTLDDNVRFMYEQKGPWICFSIKLLH